MFSFANLVPLERWAMGAISKSGKHLVKNHQKFKTALKRVCLCLVTVVVAVGISSNCIWPISPLYWKGAHHSPRDAKHKGKYKQTPISGSINHELLTTFGSHSPLPPSCCNSEGSLLSGPFSQDHHLHESTLCGTGSPLDVARFHFIPSPRVPWHGY